MSDIDNKAPGQGGEGAGDNHTPATPEPSQAAPVVTPPAASQDEMVTIKKSDYEAMKGRQAALDKKENRINKKAKAVGLGQSFNFNNQPGSAAPAAPASKDDGDDGSAEDRKAERGLINLALKPEYRDVLDANPTLRDMLTKNPLSALPIYASDAIDADDAVELIEERLLEMKGKLPKPATPPEQKPPEKPVEVPPAGGENGNFMTGRPVALEGMQDPEYVDNLKKGDTRSIATGLAHRLKRSFKK